jgi:hypothetical protein
MRKSASHTKLVSKHDNTRSHAGPVEGQGSLGTHICVQREANGLGVQPHAPALVRDVLNTPGQPLDAETRSVMEPRFGYDFSGVRVHADAKADQSAKSVSANAYTAGSHMAFASGRYAPSSRGGQQLIAHELTHVVQQASGPVASTQVAEGLSVSHPQDRFEREARSSSISLGSGVSIGSGSKRSLTDLPMKQPAASQTSIQRADSDLSAAQSRGAAKAAVTSADAGVASAAFGGLSAVFGGIGLIAAFQSAAAGERQADAAEYQAAGGFTFDSYNFGPFNHEGQTIPQPGKDKQGGPDEGADELPPIPLIQVVAGDANEAVVELTLRSNGKDILGGIIEQSDSRGYGGGPRGASGNLVFTGTNQLANAGDVSIVAIHFRGTNHPAGKPVQRFHGRIVLGANGVVYRVECSHTSGMEGVVADCNSQRLPPIIVGSGRKALKDNPSSGELPAQRRARALKGTPGENPINIGSPNGHQGEPAGDSGPEPPGGRQTGTERA